MSETTNSPLHLPPVHGFSEKRLQQHHHSFDRAVHDLQGRLKRLVARKVAVKREPVDRGSFPGGKSVLPRFLT
ncbi:hypothetical protein QW131_31910 [Roseibium salinum]|nr:hypothetical protein [Roseibium salinum]